MKDEENIDFLFNDALKLGFVGQFIRSLDSKNRIALPPNFKNLIGGKSFFAVCIPSDEGKCLRLYKNEDIKDVVEAEEFAQDDAETRQEFRRYIYSRLNLCILDSQSRFSLEKRFLDFAGIEKDVLLFGVDSHIELWNPERFDDVVIKGKKERIKGYIPTK